jgi:hypothetical protein
MFARLWKFTTKKNFSYILNIFLKFSKKLDKTYIVILNIKLKSFQINLMLESCFKLQFFNKFLNIYSLGITFFFQFCDFNFWGNFFCCFHFFPIKITMFKKFETRSENLPWAGQF